MQVPQWEVVPLGKVGAPEGTKSEYDAVGRGGLSRVRAVVKLHLSL